MIQSPFETIKFSFVLGGGIGLIFSKSSILEDKNVWRRSSSSTFEQEAENSMIVIIIRE